MVKNWPFVLLIALTFSCHHKDSIKSGNSDEFKILMDGLVKRSDNNHLDRGLKYLDSGYYQLKKPYLDDSFRRLAFHYVYWKRVKNDNKQAVLYADSMLQIAKRCTGEQYSHNYAEANFALGDAYFDLQQYNEAYQCYYQGYLIGKNYLPEAMSGYTYRMGMIMYKQAHYKLAANYFKESYKLGLPYGENFVAFYRRQELLDNIGLSYRHNGDLDSSLAYFDKALALIDSKKEQFAFKASDLEMARGVIYGNMAEAAIMKGDLQQAKFLLKKSIAINLQPFRDGQDAELSEIKLAKIYQQENHPDSLINILNNLRKQLDTLKNDNAEMNWNRLMSSYYITGKDYVRAYDHLEKYNILNDSATKRDIQLRESDVNQKLENWENEYQIENLKNHNKLQSIYLYVSVLCSVMAVIIIFLVVRNWRKSKRDVLIVSELNKQVGEQKVDLEKTLFELNSSSQEKDRILRTVAHDLRNPISGIASLTTVMVDEDGYNPEQKELLKLIRETSLDTIELINEILEATNNNETELQKQLVDINTLLANSVELMRFKAAEKQQQVLLDCPDNPEELLINREKIRRVIGNLISNAIKFSPAGGVISVKVIDKGTNVEISVNDHGIGIPDKNKDKVFNMFTEAKRPGTQGEKSFGLGLSICRQIVEKHHGKIWFESNSVSGTTFYVQLDKPKIS